MSNLRDLGRGKWLVRINLEMKPGGKRRQISRTFEADGRRKADVEAKRIEIRLRKEDKTGVLSPGSLGELIEDWYRVRVRKGLSPTTLVDYGGWAKVITKRFGNVRAAEITGAMIDAWYSELADAGMKPPTIRHGASILGNILTFGHKKRDLPLIATHRATLPEYRQPEIVKPSNDDVRRLVVMLAELDAEWARCVEMIARTGMRRGEVVGLKWADWRGDTIVVRHSIVKPTGYALTVKETKGKQDRTIALGGGEAVLERQRAHVDLNGTSPWVFPSWRDDPGGSIPRSPGSLTLAWQRFRKANGFDSINLHHLRHWYASTALSAGVPVHELSPQLGHRQTSTTLDMYAHADEDGLRRGASAIDGVLGLGSPKYPGS